MKRWLRYLWANEDGFFGIGMGPSSEEKTQYGELSGAANFGTGQGESDILQAQNFWSSILSGDMSKISQVLGPQISAVNKQGQQQKKTMFEFGNRGGGTNSSAQSMDDNTRSAIQSMISSLTGSAASNLGSMGTSLFGTGVSAHGTAFNEANTIQQQQQAKTADIFKSIGSVAGAAAMFTPAGGIASKLLTGFEGTMES